MGVRRAKAFVFKPKALSAGLGLLALEALRLGVPKLSPAIGELRILNIIKSSFSKVT